MTPNLTENPREHLCYPSPSSLLTPGSSLALLCIREVQNVPSPALALGAQLQLPKPVCAQVTHRPQDIAPLVPWAVRGSWQLQLPQRDLPGTDAPLLS